jgi:hypothetical protein
LSAAIRKSCAPLLVLVTRNTVTTWVRPGLVTVAAPLVSSAMNMIRLSTTKLVAAPLPAPGVELPVGEELMTVCGIPLTL